MAQLQFITQPPQERSYYTQTLIALESGCRWIQLRMKDEPLPVVRQMAERVRRICTNYGATLIIDDYVDIALEVKADGVHLGQNDMPIAQARQRLGNNFIIGGTANTFEDIVRLHREGANYIGCGPFRFTTTKKNLSPILGLEGYKQLIAQMRAAHIHLPLIAIGGITCSDIPALLEVGVDGIALSGAVMHAWDPVLEFQNILRLLS